MFPSSSSGLSLTKVIGAISKTLNIAQQVIPLYNKAKPMVNGIKSFIEKVPNTSKTIVKKNNETNKKTITNSNSLINNPTFFH